MLIFIRVLTFIFCFYNIGILKICFFSILIFLFWILFEINLCLLSESERRGLGFYINNIVLVFGVVGLIGLNIKESQESIIYLENTTKNLSVSSKEVYFIALTILSLTLILICILNYLEIEAIPQKTNRTLLPFRKKELEILENYLKTDEGQTILLDGKIGNGKTELIENLIQGKTDEKFETIYLKLPLVESVDELKKIVILELKVIFSKYGINSSYLNEFLGKVTCFKTNLFELSFNSNRNNNWNNIQVLKSNLKALEKKGIRVIIILDDIEREEDPNKIKKSIYFLGELAEYFRNTTAAVLFLAEHEKIIKKLQKKEKEEFEIKDFDRRKDIKNEENENFDKNLLNKYFGYIMQIGEIDLEELTQEEIIILIGKEIKNKETTEKYAEFIVELLTKFSKIYKEKSTRRYSYKNGEEYPVVILENVRNIKRFLKQVRIMSEWSEYKSTTWLILNITSILNIFLEIKSKKGKDEKEKIKKELFDEIMKSYGKIIRYDLVREEIEKIELLLEKGRKIPENFIVKFEEAIKIIDKELILEKEIKLYYPADDILFKYIGESKDKLNALLESNIIVDKYKIINKINQMNLESLDFLSSESKEKFKTMLLTRKLSSLEEELNDKYDELDSCHDEEREFEEMSIDQKVEKEKCRDVEEREQILTLIKKDKFFEKYFKEIREVSLKEHEEEIISYRHYLEKDEWIKSNNY